jgi:predicted nucleotidyltransferase
MSSTGVSDWWIGQVDWATPAGRLVRQFVEALPQGKPRRFVVNGSAALQLTLDATWLSDGVDLFSSDDEDLTPLVETAGFGPGRGELYIEAGYSLSFRAGTRWPTRAKEYHIDGASVTIPHPVDRPPDAIGISSGIANGGRFVSPRV